MLCFLQIISGEQRSHKSGLGNSAYEHRKDISRPCHETQKHPSPSKPHFNSSSDDRSSPPEAKSNSYSSLDEKTRHGYGKTKV